MANSASKIPQIVPSRRCFSCDVCCRFPEKDSFLRPFFTREEIQAAIRTGISPEFFSDPDGCQIDVIPNPLPGAEGYICPCFNPENGQCKIYEVRPLDCQLYPVALMREGPASGLASDGPGCGGIGGAAAPHGPPQINEQGEGVVVGLDTKCPYVQEHQSDAAMPQYVREVASLLDSSEMLHQIDSNPSLVQRHQDDVIFMYPLEGMTRALKGQGK